VTVALSILGIAVGPTLVALGRAREAIHLIVDGFVLGLMPTLILFRILPLLYTQLGASALVLVPAGYVGFWIVSHSSARLRLATAFAVATFAVHSLVDGASLAVASRSGASRALTLGLVAHRLPEGLLVGALLLPRYGVRGTAAATLLLAAATIFGALAGQKLLAYVDDHLLHIVLALGMGGMLRLVLHRHNRGPQKRDVMLGAFGFVVGAILAIAVPVADEVETTELGVRAQR
jgi:hypothetical protein